MFCVLRLSLSYLCVECAAYKETTYFWQSVILVRRTTLVCLTLISDNLTRGLAFTIVNGGFLVIHMGAVPYRIKSFNHFETLSLFLLLLTSALTCRYSPPYPDDVQKGLFVLIGFPTIAMAAAIFFIKVARSSRRLRQLAPQLTEADTEDGVDGNKQIELAGSGPVSPSQVLYCLAYVTRV